MHIVIFDSVKDWRKNERIGVVLPNLNSFLARDLGLNLLSVLFVYALDSTALMKHFRPNFKCEFLLSCILSRHIFFPATPSLNDRVPNDGSFQWLLEPIRDLSWCWLWKKLQLNPFYFECEASKFRRRKRFRFYSDFWVSSPEALFNQIDDPLTWGHF